MSGKKKRKQNLFHGTSNKKIDVNRENPFLTADVIKTINLGSNI